MNGILILGEAPGGKTSGGLTRSRISDLAGRPWDEWADWRNLVEEWPGRAGKGSAWNARAAASRAAELYASGDLARYDLVVLLGRRVAGAMVPAGAGLPFFRRVERGGAAMVMMPHTSGIVRWWNDPENVAAARAFLRSIAGPTPQGGSQMSSTTTTTATAAKPAAKPDAFAPIHADLVEKIRALASGRKLVETEKKGYVRFALDGSTLAYVHKPTRASVRVEVPAEGGGYHDSRVKDAGGVDAVGATVRARAEAIQPKAKAAPRAKATPAKAAKPATDVQPDAKPSQRAKRRTAATA